MLFHHIALLDPGIVEQDNAWYRMRFVRYLIKKGDEIVALGRSLLGFPSGVVYTLKMKCDRAKQNKFNTLWVPAGPSGK